MSQPFGILSGSGVSVFPRLAVLSYQKLVIFSCHANTPDMELKKGIFFAGRLNEFPKLVNTV